jgi:hypothetical protein
MKKPSKIYLKLLNPMRDLPSLFVREQRLKALDPEPKSRNHTPPPAGGATGGDGVTTSFPPSLDIPEGIGVVGAGAACVCNRSSPILSIKVSISA